MSEKAPEQPPPEKVILLGPEHKEIHAAVGAAIDAYSYVEGAQYFLLATMLGIPEQMASVVFFSVQNVRTRHELIHAILTIKHGNKYAIFWEKCGAFLQKLAKFRNAVAHWHPVLTLYVNKKLETTRHAFELRHPAAGADFLNLRTEDIPNFIKDCRYIQQEIFALSHELKTGQSEIASPDRFLKPSLRRNLAVLRRRLIPKEQSSQPESSQLSDRQTRKPPSAKQRRMRALAARKKGAKNATPQS